MQIYSEMLAVLWALRTTTNEISFLTCSVAEDQSIKGSSTGQATCGLPTWKGSLRMFAQGYDE